MPLANTGSLGHSLRVREDKESLFKSYRYIDICGGRILVHPSLINSGTLSCNSICISRRGFCYRIQNTDFWCSTNSSKL